MPRSMLIRSIIVAVTAAAIVPVAFSQSQDSQSVAEAARRAREKKKDAAAKPAKVITDETLDVKKGDVQSAVAEEPKIAGAPDTKPQAAPGAPANAAAKDEKREKLKKELTELKEQVKQSLMDLDLLQRENRLDQDAYYSQPNYGSDTAGKQKLDDEKQQISNKQEEVARLKAKLADLQREMGESSSPQS
jgi:molecular chaperone GrpE (heat shock protein)